jgi:hypothetical protein
VKYHENYADIIAKFSISFEFIEVDSLRFTVLQYPSRTQLLNLYIKG